MKNLAIYLMFIAIVSLLLLLAGGSKEAPPVVYVTKEVPMSIIESQQKLIDLGFTEALVDGVWKEVKADGKDGPIWRQALNDYYASKHFPKQEIPKELQKL